MTINTDRYAISTSKMVEMAIEFEYFTDSAPIIYFHNYDFARYQKRKIDFTTKGLSRIRCLSINSPLSSCLSHQNRIFIDHYVFEGGYVNERNRFIVDYAMNQVDAL